jgi:hypothetical protein
MPIYDFCILTLSVIFSPEGCIAVQNFVNFVKSFII